MIFGVLRIIRPNTYHAIDALIKNVNYTDCKSKGDYPMLSFRQFLECNDIDTSLTKADDLGSMNWHYEPAYRMYCNAMAHELQKNPNYRAYTPPFESLLPSPHDVSSL